MPRRLPVYFLIDCSGSMDGQPAQAVWSNLERLQEELLRNPMAMDTVYLSVITFATEAKELVPLTALTDFQTPREPADGFTALGKALDLLADCVERDVKRKRSETERGDYRPIVFLFTDGYPTDSAPALQAAIQRVRGVYWGQFVACAGGHHVDTETLLKITDDVIQMQDLTPDTLASFFKWVSDSIALHAVSLRKPDAAGASGSLASPASAMPSPSGNVPSAQQLSLPQGFVNLKKS